MLLRYQFEQAVLPVHLTPPAKICGLSYPTWAGGFTAWHLLNTMAGPDCGLKQRRDAARCHYLSLCQLTARVEPLVAGSPPGFALSHARRPPVSSLINTMPAPPAPA